MYHTPEGYVEVRIHHVVFTKSLKDGQTIKHNARIITYVDVKKRKLITLLTNNMEFDPNEVIAIYRQRWKIELLFKQMKQNFPFKYFYVESASLVAFRLNNKREIINNGNLDVKEDVLLLYLPSCSLQALCLLDIG